MGRFPLNRFFTTLSVLSFLAVSVALIITVNVQQRKQALVESEHKALLLLDHNLAIHTYFSKQLKPKVFELSDPYRSGNYFEPAWMSSTYAVREISRYLNELSSHDYYYKECALNARSPENEADGFEMSVLQQMQQDPGLTTRSGIRVISGNPFFEVIRRGESMEQTCLRCHSTPEAAPGQMVERYGPSRSFNRRAGELVSAISIRIPLAEAYAAANTLSLKLSVLLLAILGISAFVQLFAMRRLLLGPIGRIRDRALAIMQDDGKLGEEIPPLTDARELQELVDAFNSLSRHLRREKDGLVDQVRQRTADLEAAKLLLERDVAERTAMQEELAGKVAELEAALAKVKLLEGIIPICSYCKKIRKDDTMWQQLEQYISEHSEALFSHAICPDCFDKAAKTLVPRPKENP
jgi:hypothetical protein